MPGVKRKAATAAPAAQAPKRMTRARAAAQDSDSATTRDDNISAANQAAEVGTTRRTTTRNSKTSSTTPAGALKTRSKVQMNNAVDPCARNRVDSTTLSAARTRSNDDVMDGQDRTRAKNHQKKEIPAIAHVPAGGAAMPRRGRPRKPENIIAQQYIGDDQDLIDPYIDQTVNPANSKHVPTRTGTARRGRPRQAATKDSHATSDVHSCKTAGDEDLAPSHTTNTKGSATKTLPMIKIATDSGIAAAARKRVQHDTVTRSRVRFDNDQDKENVSSSRGTKKSIADEAESCKSTVSKASGMRAKPLRKGASATTKSITTKSNQKLSKPSAEGQLDIGEERSKEDSGNSSRKAMSSPLSPKKVPQVAKGSLVISEDELMVNVTSITRRAGLPSRSPLKTPPKFCPQPTGNLPLDPLQSTLKDQALARNQSHAPTTASPSSRAPSGNMTSPPRRNPVSPRKDGLQSPPKKAAIVPVPNTLIRSTAQIVSPAKQTLLAASPVKASTVGAAIRSNYTQRVARPNIASTYHPILQAADSFAPNLLQSPPRRLVSPTRRITPQIQQQAQIGKGITPARAGVLENIADPKDLTLCSPKDEMLEQNHKRRSSLTHSNSEISSEASNHDQYAKNEESPTACRQQCSVIERLEFSSTIDNSKQSEHAELADSSQISQEACATTFSAPTVTDSTFRRISYGSQCSEDELASPDPRRHYAPSPFRPELPCSRESSKSPQNLMAPNQDLKPQYSFTPLAAQFGNFVASSPKTTKQAQSRRSRGIFSFGAKSGISEISSPQTTPNHNDEQNDRDLKSRKGSNIDGFQRVQEVIPSVAMTFDDHLDMITAEGSATSSPKMPVFDMAQGWGSAVEAKDEKAAEGESQFIGQIPETKGLYCSPDSIPRPAEEFFDSNSQSSTFARNAGQQACDDQSSVTFPKYTSVDLLDDLSSVAATAQRAPKKDPVAIAEICQSDMSMLESEKPSISTGNDATSEQPQPPDHDLHYRLHQPKTPAPTSRDKFPTQTKRIFGAQTASKAAVQPAKRSKQAGDLSARRPQSARPLTRSNLSQPIPGDSAHRLDASVLSAGVSRDDGLIDKLLGESDVIVSEVKKSLSCNAEGERLKTEAPLCPKESFKVPTGAETQALAVDTPDASTLNQERAKSKTLKGAVVYVDVHTSEGAEASGIFVDLLTQMGARCIKQWTWSPRTSSVDSHGPVRCSGGSAPQLGLDEASSFSDSSDSVRSSHGKNSVTHVIYKDGGKRTLEKIRASCGAIHCVGVGWVLDCEREGRWLDESKYAVDLSITPRGGGRRRRSMEPRALQNGYESKSSPNMPVPASVHRALDTPCRTKPTPAESLSPTKEFLTFNTPAARRDTFVLDVKTISSAQADSIVAAEECGQSLSPSIMSNFSSPSESAESSKVRASIGSLQDDWAEPTVRFDATAFTSRDDHDDTVDLDVTIPATPPGLIRGAKLVQKTCPPRQRMEGLFPPFDPALNGDFLNGDDGYADEDGQRNGSRTLRQRLLALRRQSLQWTSKTRSPLGKNVTFATRP